MRSGWFFNKNHFNASARHSDLSPENVFVRSEFVCDFLMPVANVFFTIAATLASQGDIVARIGFHRQKQEGNFSDRDKKIVNILFPHMARAIHIRNLMNRVEPSREPDGVIAMGEDDRPFYMNHTAKQLLKGSSAASIPNPGMGPGPVFYRSKSGAYRVRTMPLSIKRKGRIVLLERYPPAHRLHPKLADSTLSRREREIAVLAIQGYSNREIAERSFICEQTVKDHLHTIFEKLEIRSRGELTAKVLELRSENLMM
jgi:DNA-binding CsgD family transcriptional regulator